MTDTCGFLVSWVGYCTRPKPCPKHAHVICRTCGAPATQDCGNTGMLVCGEPCCDEHGKGNMCPLHQRSY